MRPEVGSTRRLTMRIVVVLPQPDGPTSTAICPASTSSDSSLTATVPSAYCLRTRSSTIIDCAASVSVGCTTMVLPAAADCLVRNEWICGKYVSTRSDTILADLKQHVMLTVVAVLVGFVVSVPLTLLVRRFRRTEGIVIGMTSVLYSIPSVALFAILVPFTGLTARTVEIGLVIYTLVIFVRNTLAGLDSVPDDVRDAARGMGMGPIRMFLRVELPLALPAILAGFRVATVSTVALVTVGALVGTGGLGQELNDAFSSYFKAEALTASVLCVLLALTADLLIVGVGWLLTPWRRGRRT